MRGNQVEPSLTLLCRILGVSPCECYARLGRPLSARSKANRRLLERTWEICRLSRETCGRPGMHAELRDDGWMVNQ